MRKLKPREIPRLPGPDLDDYYADPLVNGKTLRQEVHKAIDFAEAWYKLGPAARFAYCELLELFREPLHRSQSDLENIKLGYMDADIGRLQDQLEIYAFYQEFVPEAFAELTKKGLIETRENGKIYAVAHFAHAAFNGKHLAVLPFKRPRAKKRKAGGN